MRYSVSNNPDQRERDSRNRVLDFHNGTIGVNAVLVQPLSIPPVY
jgi:hypothetical protein